jgi:branched-subunit amino acid aminotransferase/4-amino-4-deoxychorismate lyase
MHRRVILNQRMMDAAKARLPANTSATLHGRGVFTTLAIYHGEPFLWRAHWERLSEHAACAGVDLGGFEEAAVRASLMRLIAANRVGEGRARVTLLARAVRGLWKMENADGRSTDLLITTGAARSFSDAGLALTVSPYRANTLSPLAGIKSINFLERILAWEEARARDFDEAVRLNERGEIVSATLANIFWVKDGTLHTPALSTGALAGTTRARVIELAIEMSVPLVEGVYDLAHLGDADEIFLTSAVVGVGLVSSFDYHRYTVPMASVALHLREAFRQLTLAGSH